MSSYPVNLNLTELVDTSGELKPGVRAEAERVLDECDTPSGVPGPNAYTEPRRRLTPVPNLDDILEGDDPDFDQEPVAAIDADQADRWLRRLGHLHADDRADEELANARIATINTWLMARREQRRRAVEYLERSLELWHAANVANGAAKTITLPAGKVASRAQQPEWDFDDAAFLAWATEHAPDLVNQPAPPAPRPDKPAAKKALTVAGLDRARPGDELPVVDENGEVVPGLVVVARGPKVTVAPA